MSQPHMDHNDLARLLDRRLSEDEHGRALAHLADSDDDAEVLGDAAYLLRDLEGQNGATDDDDADADHPHTNDADTGTGPKVVPLRPPSTARVRPRRLPVRWLALAAMLAGVLLVPLALSRSGSRAPGDFASLLTSREAGLPDSGWVGRNRWTGTRGEGDLSADLPLAAKLGALQTALEVAAAGGQAEETELLAEHITVMLTMPGSGAVAAAYRDIAARAKEPAETLAPSVASARESLVAFMDKDYFSLGAWTEAAAIAARRRDAAFFRAHASQNMLDRAASLPSLDGEARGAVGAIRTATEADQLNWQVLETQANVLLRSVADARPDDGL